MRESRLILLACGLAAALPPAPVFGEPEWGESPFLAERGGSKQSESRAPGSGEEQLLLQGVLWDLKAPTAIINNRCVARGDHVGRWEVKEIRKSQVVLSDGSATRVLRAE